MTSGNLSVKRVVLSAAVVLGALSGYIQGSTVAYFTDSASSAQNQFSTGKVVILTPSSGSPPTTVVTLSNMVPGDKVTSLFQVTNDGTVPLNYALSTSLVSGSQSLAQQLRLAIAKDLDQASCTNSGFSGGTTVYASAPLSPVGAIAFVDSSAVAGKHRITVASSDVLCFQVALDSSATSADTSVTIAFAFVAEQA